MGEVEARSLRVALVAANQQIVVLRDERDWATAGWAEADRCAASSATMAADLERELRGRSDPAIAALDELVFLREELQRVQRDRDHPDAQRRATIRTLHKLADKCEVRGYRYDAQRLREAVDVMCSHDTPDGGDAVGEEGR